MTPQLAGWFGVGAVITAFAVVNLPFLIVLLKGTFMPTDAFKNALAALTAAFQTKIDAQAQEIAALNAQITALQDAATTADAAYTADVTAATPAA